MMSVYQQMLQYYLSSETHFLHFLEWFYECYQYHGECEQGEKRYHFHTRQYSEFWEKEHKEYGFHIELNDLQIDRYFTTLFEEHQLFAVVFAHWCGLSQRQIAQIANLKRFRISWDVLSFFICNSSMDIYSGKKQIEKGQMYPGDYFVIIGERIYPALRKGNTLIVPDTGEVFEIL